MSYSLISYRRIRRSSSKQGFTLIEMLIAMAITLLMMAAVARAFAFVGERVRDSRGNVSLSSELRDVTTRLNDELRNCTVTLDPVGGNDADPNGYFLYYEGPMTDATTTIFGRYSTQIEEGSTVAQDSRFGDLDDYLAFTAIAPPGAWFTGQVPAYLLNAALDPGPMSPTRIAANTPVVIRSRYAEIVYFVNPERNATGDIIDVDGDLIADRLMLYRRVLLIRPDLNLSGSDTLLRLSATSNWLNGMTPVHQVADLSVCRQLNADGSPGTGLVANTLAELAQPHNRFGHVRIPWGTVTSWSTGGGGGGSPDYSMPVLALEDLDAGGLLLSDSTSPPSYRPPPQTNTTATSSPVVTPFRMSGYLHRDFVLTGDRRGEDVIANNVRALDVQIFDPTAAFYLSPTGLVVGPGDAGYRDVLNDTATTITDVPGGGFVDLAYPVLAGGPTRGWGTLTTSTSPGAGIHAIPPALHSNLINIQSQFSGLELNSTTTFPSTTSDKTYSNALLKSGRVVIMNGRVVFFQPAFDTYTSAYERDSYYQNRRYNSPLFLGTNWEQFDAADASFTDLAADGIDTDSTLFPGQFGTDDTSERETSAPFVNKPEAIRVTVRLEDVGTRQLRQMSVVHGNSL